MNNEERYYVPQKEEFCVGFEYEYLSCDKTTWSKSILDINDMFCPDSKYITQTGIEDVFNHLDVGGIRVKRLDREDIESLGWKFMNEHSGKMYFEWPEKGFSMRPSWMALHNGRVIMEYFGEDGGTFYGKIANKHELKVLMKQLGV